MPAAVGSQTPVPSAVSRLEAIQEKAQRLAEFFNGEVISLDDPIDGILRSLSPLPPTISIAAVLRNWRMMARGVAGFGDGRNKK